MRRPIARLSLVLALGAPAADAFVWPSTIARTESDLSAPDVGVRRRAARALDSLPAASVRRIAPGALADADVEVRVAALAALLDVRASGLGKRIASWLGDPDPRIRRVAADALAKDPFLDAVPALGRVLGDPDPAVRTAAARALGASGIASAVVPLLGRLDDTEPEVREAVTDALALLGDRSAVVPLIGKIQDGRPSVRRGVAVALGVLGDVRASGALALSLRDPDESVRIAALAALGKIHAEDTVPTIVSLLGEERRPAVREAAFQALSELPSDAGIAALVNALSDEDTPERSPAVSALVNAGTRAVPQLTACLNGQTLPATADGCALALGRIGKGTAVGVIVSALRRNVVRPAAALHALGDCEDPSALGPVLEYLGSEDPWVRRASVDAATKLLDPEMPDGRAVEAIERAIDAAHGRSPEQADLIALLGKTGSPRAAPFLVAAAKDTVDVPLRLVAIRALGNVGRSGQDAVLLAALSDDRADVRLAAALSLRLTASAASATALVDRLVRAAEQDRSAIGIALPGALATLRDPKVVARVEALVVASTGADRDTLIEALGVVPGTLGSASLARLLTSGLGASGRAKVAEALGGHPEALGTLAVLLRDPDSSVRANAIWAFGAVARAGDQSVVLRSFDDPDLDVSGNAVAALGRIGARGGTVASTLCNVLADPRPYVRANALDGLYASGARCTGNLESTILERDPEDFVRAAAAKLVRRVPSSDAARDRTALMRCAADASAEVALACVAPRQKVAGASGPVTVYVVPSGAAEPVPRAPFALFTADGFVRLGLADERGSVFEPNAPAGFFKLGIPAPLVE